MVRLVRLTQATGVSCAHKCRLTTVQIASVSRGLLGQLSGVLRFYSRMTGPLEYGFHDVRRRRTWPRRIGRRTLGRLGSTRERVPGQCPQKSIQVFQKRLRQFGREGLADRVLGSVCGASANGHSSKVDDRGVAKSVRNVGQEGGPAVGAALPGAVQQPIGIARRRQRGFVDGRSLVPGRSPFSRQLQAR